MMTWLIYDITEDKIRKEVIRIAQHYGMYRVQKSVFLGEVDKNKLDKIIEESKKAINLEEDSVYIFPMCEADYQRSVLLGLSFEEGIVRDEKPVLFF